MGPIFERWLEPFHDLGADTVTHRDTGSTDHLAFAAVGLPGFQFVQDMLDYGTRTHHSNLDHFDHAVEDDLKQASVVLASFLYHAAMRDQLLPARAAAAAAARGRGRAGARGLDGERLLERHALVPGRSTSTSMRDSRSPKTDADGDSRAPLAQAASDH